MGYKTILVHCNDRQRLSRLLDPAVTLCASFGAHLVGVSVTPPIAVIAAGMPGAPDVIVIDEHAKAYQAENSAMKAAFEKAANSQNVTAEWREPTRPPQAMREICVDQSCIVVLSRAELATGVLLTY